MSKQLYKLFAVVLVLLSSACGQIASNNGAGEFQSSVEAACGYIEDKDLPESIVLNVPYVRQDVNYCGPATLSMVMGYYGTIVEQHVIGADIVDSTGTSTGELVDKAELYGFQGMVVSCDFSGLLKLVATGKPVVARILNDMGAGAHFIVITGYDKFTGMIFFNDSDQPNKKMLSFDSFQDRWNIRSFDKPNNSYNLALVIEPTAKIAQSL